MKRFERTSTIRSTAVGLTMLIPSITGRLESTANNDIKQPTQTSPEVFAEEMGRLCHRLYFDSEGTQCTGSTSTPNVSNDNSLSDDNLVEFTDSMEDLGHRLRFDQ